MNIPISLTALLLASRIAGAQQANGVGEPIRVSIERFTSNGPEADPLHSILPNVLQAGLLQFGSLSADVASRAAGELAAPGSGRREYQWRIRGRYVLQGQRIRVDVILENIEKEFDLPAVSVTFEPAEMLSQMQELAQRCGRALLRSATNATDETSVDALFTDAGRGKLNYLAGTIPRAVARAIAAAGLGEPESPASTGGGRRRFQVSGSFQVSSEGVRVTIRVADRSGEPLSFEVASADKIGTTLPDTVADRVVEAVRGMMDVTADPITGCYPPAPNARFCLAAGYTAWLQRKQNLAIVLYRRAQTSEASARLIRIYVEMRQTDAAISEARLLSSTTGNTARAHLSSALVSLLRSEPAQAIQEFNRTLAMNVEPALKPYVYLWLADAQLVQAEAASNEDERAAAASGPVTNYLKAFEGGISDDAAYLSFARASAIAKQSEKAINTIEAAYDRDQKNDALREALASLYRNEGIGLYDSKRYGDAEPWLEKALALNPAERSVVADAASRSASIIGFHTDPPKRSEAIDLLERAITAEPNDEWSFWAIGRLYRDQARENREPEDDYNRAVEALKKAVSIGTDYTDYWDLADLYSEMNQPDRARETLQNAAGARGSASQIGESYVRLARAYRDLGDTDRALAALDSALGKRPGDEWVVRSRAGILQQAARYNEAVQAWKDAQALSATRYAYLGLGDTYRQMKRFSDAEAEYQKAIKLDPDCSNCYIALARTLALEGKRDDALAAVRLGLAKPEADSEYTSAVVVYGSLKELDLARTELESWRKQFPDSAAAQGAAAFFWHEYAFEFEKEYQYLQFERGYEQEADFLAVQTMAKAGWDPEALARYIEREQAPSKAQSFSTLPDREARVATIRKAMVALPPREYSTAAEFPAIQAEVHRLAAESAPDKALPAPPH